MPSVRIEGSPLVGGPATISYRESGSGPSAVVFLHGGWGYQVFPFDAQVRRLDGRCRIFIPDRSGHGASSPVDTLPVDFHRRAAEETIAFLDALGIEKAVWWGHSDGAVIAAVAAIDMPDRVHAVILEALHFYRSKPGSRPFFERMASAPDTFGESLKATLNQDHGAGWRRVLRLDGQAWLNLADTGENPAQDLYAGKLSLLTRPTLLIHGGQDPRSEPGEHAATCACLPDAIVLFLPDAGQSPHSEPACADIVSSAAEAFLEKLSW